MDLNTILLVTAALLPAVVLCCYIYSKDRVEKEPVRLLLLLLMAGIAIIMPTIYVGRFIGGIIDGLFGVTGNGKVMVSPLEFHLYTILDNFIGVALVEEGFKLLALWLITKKEEEFDCLFDGLIYAIFVSLGFAAFENVMYVLEYGWATAVTRAVLSVPGHMFFAVMMGYYYSIAHITDRAIAIERRLKEEGLIEKSTSELSSKRTMVLSLAVPVLLHGAYDYCCSVDAIWAIIGLYVLVIFMYVHCFGKIKKMSRLDGGRDAYAKAIIMKKYPELEKETELV